MGLLRLLDRRRHKAKQKSGGGVAGRQRNARACTALATPLQPPAAARVPSQQLGEQHLVVDPHHVVDQLRVELLREEPSWQRLPLG